MKLKRLAPVFAALAIMFAAGPALADDYSAGEVGIQHLAASPTPPGARVGAAYFVLENRGDKADRLLRASTPVAASVELHSAEIGTDGVMRMRPLDALPVAPKSTLSLRPGQGHHLMLIGLKQPLVKGQFFPMTLEFERGGSVEVSVGVEEAKDHASPAGAHKH